jgi:hypothetical protein
LLAKADAFFAVVLKLDGEKDQVSQRWYQFRRH